MSTEEFTSAFEKATLPVEFSIDFPSDSDAIAACARLGIAEFTTIRDGTHVRAMGRRVSGKVDPVEG